MSPGRPPQQPRDPSPFGARLLEACEAEGITPTALERKAKLGNGRVSKLIYPPSGKNATIDPFTVETFSDILHADYHWLMTGRGSMRPPKYTDSARDEGARVARGLGAREDAIEIVMARPDEGQDVRFWNDAFLAESDRLRRAGVPEPHEIVRAQNLHRRRKGQVERLTADAKKAPPPKAEPSAAEIAGTGTHGRKK